MHTYNALMSPRRLCCMTGHLLDERNIRVLLSDDAYRETANAPSLATVLLAVWLPHTTLPHAGDGRAGRDLQSLIVAASVGLVLGRSQRQRKQQPYHPRSSSHNRLELGVQTGLRLSITHGHMCQDNDSSAHPCCEPLCSRTSEIPPVQLHFSKSKLGSDNMCGSG